MISVFSSNCAERPHSSGTGFIVHPDGYILSNHHVVEGADKLEVVLADGTKHVAKVVATGEAVDIVLLKIDGKNLAAVALGDSDKMDVTDYVMAVGHPLAFSIASSASAYEGKINAKREDLEIPRFQIDATINPGNSGGPLLNDRGEVIGIIEGGLDAKAFLQNAGFLPQRVSFALPINLAKNLLKNAYPSGVPKAENRAKLEPKAIFNLVKPSVVLVLNYIKRPVDIAEGFQALTITLPLHPGSRELELVPVKIGKEVFLMGKCEVTQAQYEAVMGQNPSQFKHGGNYPVESVSWEEAKQFCARLTESFLTAVDELALPKQYFRDWKFRLPTDAEWSAAVGLEQEHGSTPKEKHSGIKGAYPWGTEWLLTNRAGNYGDVSTKRKFPGMATIEGYDDGYADTAPVGSFKPNNFGLYDMGGNVWEWCEDWLDGQQKQRVIRGASWRNGSPEGLLSSHRGSNTPNGRFHNIGFRVVLGGAPP